MDDILKERKNQTHAYTRLTVQMDIPVCPNKRPIYFCTVFKTQSEFQLHKENWWGIKTLL